MKRLKTMQNKFIGFQSRRGGGTWYMLFGFDEYAVLCIVSTEPDLIEVESNCDVLCVSYDELEGVFGKDCDNNADTGSFSLNATNLVAQSGVNAMKAVIYVCLYKIVMTIPATIYKTKFTVENFSIKLVLNLLLDFLSSVYCFLCLTLLAKNGVIMICKINAKISGVKLGIAKPIGNTILEMIATDLRIAFWSLSKFLKNCLRVFFIFNFSVNYIAYNKIIEKQLIVKLKGENYLNSLVRFKTIQQEIIINNLNV